MIIVYDEYKRVENLKKHGFDFANLTVEFFFGGNHYRCKARTIDSDRLSV